MLLKRDHSILSFRNCGVYYGLKTQLLLHGDEYKAASGTSCYWDDHRDWLGGVAAEGGNIFLLKISLENMLPSGLLKKASLWTRVKFLVVIMRTGKWEVRGDITLDTVTLVSQALYGLSSCCSWGLHVTTSSHHQSLVLYLRSIILGQANIRLFRQDFYGLGQQSGLHASADESDTVAGTWCDKYSYSESLLEIFKAFLILLWHVHCISQKY